MSKTFDFIIVGAGSAGCVLANRLSEDPNNQVLLLEAGGVDSQWDFRLHMPAALSYPLQGTRYNWGYYSEPEPHMNNRQVYQPRGKTLGGSSSINGMIYIRGNPGDYHHWASAEGMSHWDYAHCLPYFKRMETRLKGADDYRGGEGPLKVTTSACKNPLFDAFFEAGRQAGHRFTDDINGAQQEGIGPFDMTVYQGKRMSAARAYLRPIQHRKNLTVITRAHTSQLLMEGNRILGVEVVVGKSKESYQAGKVILSAGAINTPQLLQLSGIGDAEKLKALGIDVRADLSQVGQNLQDHLEVYVQQGCTKKVSLYPSLKIWNQIPIGIQWYLFSTGIGASNQFEAGGFIRGHERFDYPNIQFHFLPLAISYDGKVPAGGHGYQLHAGPMRSKSRGFVEIQSTDPFAPPKIQFNYLSHPDDKREWIEVIQKSREIFSQTAFDAFRGDEIAPGSAVQSEEEILEFVRNKGESAYHPVCTCRMGSDASTAVTDPQLKVHGIENLHVVDASVMPRITNGNTNAPTIMIAEKASDLILGNTPLAPINL